MALRGGDEVGLKRWREGEQRHGRLRPRGAKENMDKLDILQEIKDSRQAIESRLGTITVELNILKDDRTKLSDRLKQTSQPWQKFSRRIMRTKLPLKGFNCK
ncbi:hypothetical protein NDU88_005973 [Pleurodeles waltl]|uniref:Uncharacterized protein n=1 Tax=Pleurodeles waltl TaxID=8319 RepID=A0AAV7MBZ8_PLEWA|nr:hypothetical protein NDU88_005973 [Pleurodeles waltl]